MNSASIEDNQNQPIVTGTGNTNTQIIYQGELTYIKFNGANYLDWSRAITIALGGRRLFGYINGETRAPPEKSCIVF